MRNLTEAEVEQALDDNDEAEEGCIAIEATREELAEKQIGTCCGLENNRTFSSLAGRFGERFARGWYYDADKTVWGMFHIQCTDKEGDEIESMASDANGSLRHSGKSLWDGFREFEIE